jgi:hypothetical protein
VKCNVKGGRGFNAQYKKGAPFALKQAHRIIASKQQSACEVAPWRAKTRRAQRGRKWVCTNLSVVNASQTDTQLPEQCHCVLATVVHHLDHSRIFQDGPKPRDKYNIRVEKNVEYHRWEPVDFDLDE